MTKVEKRIAELEKRIRELEARPVTQPIYITVPRAEPCHQPYFVPMQPITAPYAPPWWYRGGWGGVVPQTVTTTTAGKGFTWNAAPNSAHYATTGYAQVLGEAIRTD